MEEIKLGDIVLFVDEWPGDYNGHAIMPALIQHIYTINADRGYVHLHIFEAYPEDNRAVDAYYSQTKEPGTWHKRS